ncbi:MAG: hypothetical protein IKX44_05155 [Prevotella sp.]|nr:hypothetical protein [Prevotella sp.]
MKKVLLLTMGLTMMFNLVSCSSDDDDNGTSGSNGKKFLAEITVKEHPWKFGERTTYGEDYENYKYDEKGNLLEKITNYYSSVTKTRLYHSYKYTYDERNRAIVMDEVGLSTYKYKYQYNEFDSVSVMQQYNDDGKLITEYTYEYDSSKRLSKLTERNALSSTSYGYVRKYSYSGNTVTEVSTMLQDGSPFGTMVWEYDSHHNLLKETWINDKTGKSTVQKDNTYQYNTKGQLTRWTSKNWVLTDELSYRDYYYNKDGTIERIHLSYSFKDDKSDLIYTYTWK